MGGPIVTWQLSHKTLNRTTVKKQQNLIQNFLILAGKSYANFSSSISIHTSLLRFAGLPTSAEIWQNSKDQIWLSNYSNNGAILDESSSSILWVRVVIIIWGRGSSRGKRKIRSLWISARQVDCCHGTPEFPHKDSFSYQKSTSDFKSGDDAALEKWCPNPLTPLPSCQKWSIKSAQLSDFSHTAHLISFPLRQFASEWPIAELRVYTHSSAERPTPGTPGFLATL
jgi:hypothetical protein